MKRLIFFILFPAILLGQTPIGLINGKVAGDNSGYSVSLSSDGTIVAISAPLNDDNGSNSGHVRVYENVLGNWTQIGSDINGEAAFNFSGESVSLSSDGTIVAIGASGNDDNGSFSGHVRVYENVLGIWTQIGLDIDGEAVNDESGHSVSLSSDGTIVAIGAYLNDGNGIDSGHVSVYEYVSESEPWVQIGLDINGEAAGDRSGHSVSLSSDGTIVAIGAYLNDGNGIDSGHVSVYKYVSDSEPWDQIGNDIYGEALGDRLGWSISLSSDGTIVAIGAPFNDGNDGTNTNRGHVRVYQYNSDLNTWIPIGDDIDGEAANDESGSGVTLSSDGTIVAIGAIANGDNGAESGHVRVYQNNSGNWTQIGSDIDGEAANDQSGTNVSLSSDGSIVAIGAPYNDGDNGINSGHVGVYDLSAVVLTSDEFVLSKFNLFPNPATNKFTIQLNSGLELKVLNIYNPLGQIISSTTKKIVDTTGLSSGMYYVEVITNNGKATKKLIIE